MFDMALSQSVWLFSAFVNSSMQKQKKLTEDGW